MLEDDPVDAVSLDSESRVRGVCQLMDGLIFDVRLLESSDSLEAQERLKNQFDSAVRSLDDFLEKGYKFILKYVERGIISAEEELKYRRIIEEKHDTTLEVLRREYAVLGMLEDME